MTAAAPPRRPWRRAICRRDEAVGSRNRLGFHTISLLPAAASVVQTVSSGGKHHDQAMVLNPVLGDADRKRPGRGGESPHPAPSVGGGGVLAVHDATGRAGATGCARRAEVPDC